MIYEEFIEILSDLELQFGKIAANEKEADRKKQAYWKRVQLWSKSDFQVVVDTLLDTWTPKGYMRFPYIRHFTDIYNDMTGANRDVTKQYEIPENELCIPGEMSVIQDIVRIIRGMHKDGKTWKGQKLIWPIPCVPKENMLAPDDWDKAGRPPLWSPVYEEYYAGVIEPMLRDIETGGSEMLEYAVSFRESLHKNKTEEIDW